MDISVNGVLKGVVKLARASIGAADPGRPVPPFRYGGRGRDPASYRGARRNAMRAIGKIADWRLGPWNALPRGEREFTVVHLGLPQKITRKRFQIIHGSLASRGQAFA